MGNPNKRRSGMKYKPRDPVKKKQAIDMYLSGHKVAEIVKAVGVSDKGLRKWIAELNTQKPFSWQDIKTDIFSRETVAQMIKHNRQFIKTQRTMLNSYEAMVNEMEQYLKQ